jgi:uncharacterized protein (UPF0333 family)
MSAQDILNIVLILLLIILVACLSSITYFLIQALKAITRLADNLEETAKDINSLKGSLQMKFLSALPLFLAGLVSKFLKRGR